MSCSDCCFPYSLCQCPAVITVGELATLRVALIDAQKELAALKAAAPAGGVGSLLVRKARAPIHCDFEDCDGEPDSTGFCETHRREFREHHAAATEMEKP